MKPYKLPEKYLPFEQFQKHKEALSLVSPLRLSAEKNYQRPNVPRHLAYLFDFWSQGYPVYCVRESLLEDMLATDVGENLALFEKIELEIPCFALFLPNKQVKSGTHVGDSFVDYLVVHHEKVDTGEYSHAITWGGVDSKEAMFFSAKRIRRDGTLKRSHFSDNNEEIQKRTLIVRNIVLQSILLLQYYPAIVTDYQPQTTTKGFSKPPAHDSKFRLPRWLGEASRISYKKGEGTGKGKSTHFRRGHWRLIEGKGDQRLVHVRPAWVNSKVK